MITLFLFDKLIFKLLLLLHVHHLVDNLCPSDGQIFAMCIIHMQLHLLVLNLISNGRVT
jgi:hypothetical protein